MMQLGSKVGINWNTITFLETCLNFKLIQLATCRCKLSLEEPSILANRPHSHSLFQLMPTFDPTYYIIICNAGKGLKIRNFSSSQQHIVYTYLI